jgi:serine protease inhibitor
VGMDTGGCTGPSPRTTKTLRFDKPFVYVIRDVGTGAILFMGRVLDPTVRG